MPYVNLLLQSQKLQSATLVCILVRILWALALLGPPAPYALSRYQVLCLACRQEGRLIHKGAALLLLPVQDDSIGGGMRPAVTYMQ